MIQNSSTSESAHLGGSGLSRVLVEVVVSERLPNGPLLVKHEAVWGGEESWGCGNRAPRTGP